MIKRIMILVVLSIGVLLVMPPRATVQVRQEIVREEFHQTYPLSPTGRINLENIQGTVRIQAWDRNEVKIDAVKTAYSREILKDAEIEINANADILKIRTKYPDGNLSFNNDDDGSYRRYQNPASVDYILSVPRNARLSSIELVNGSLELEGLSGDVTATCVNGKVTARLLRGEVKLSTVNGGLEATFDALAESKAISLGSVNGAVVVVIPSDSNAIVKAGTIHGMIKNDFGLPVRQGDYIGRELYGQIGNGGARIKLGNVNGGVNIRRASDGRTLSPAKSLLNFNERAGKGKDQSKDKSDPDFDFDFDFDSDERDAAREARRAARDASREAERAQREAHRDQSETRRDEAEAARQADEATREADEAQREAQRDSAEAVQEAERDASEAIREAAADSAREVREAQREAVRVAREASRAVRSEVDRAIRVYSEKQFRLVERDTSRFEVGNAPQVSIETFDGTVSVHGWDNSEVVVNIVKRAANENAMRGIRFSAVKDGNHVKIVATFDKASAERIAQGITSFNANVNIEVFVPRNLMLRATSGDGHLAIDGIKGQAELVTADGSIDVINGGGKLTAKTDDGRIRILKFDGIAEATTGDGRITLEGRFSQLAARTGDGTITLVLPGNVDAFIETDAERIINESDLIVTVVPDSSKRRRRWKIGNGGTVFMLRTGDGRIILRRAGER